MRIGGSLMLIAVGAVLRFGVTAEVRGLALGTIGLVLMIVGIAGLLITITMLSTRRRTDIIYGRERRELRRIRPCCGPLLRLGRGRRCDR